MIKLLSILGTVGMAGAASSTIITATNKPQTQTVNHIAVVDRTELKGKIDEAKWFLINSTKVDWANQNLAAAIERAQATFDDPNATQIKIDEMTNWLSVAIELFQASPEASNADKLKDLIDEAKELLAHNNKGEVITMLFKSIIDSAETTLNTPEVTPKQIDSAIKMLEEAIEVYVNSPDVN